jgi:putative ABC transport system permease protein
MQKIMKNVADDFSDYAKEDINSFTQGLQNSMMNYLNSQDSKQVINQFIDKVIKDNHLDAQLNTIMSGYMQTVTKQMSTALSQAFTFNPDVFKQAIKMNRDGADMTELLKSMMNTEQSSYDNNMKKFGYCSFDDPSSISIYPQDFEKKQSVLDYLDHYNEKMKKIDEEKVITYTDVVGTLMSSVTDIVDVISYVLIAFVGISLVVSSIMIGVITYISVLERKKEIGILRAIGASKHNISQVFNAETFIVGLLSGLMGIGITLILLIPTNIIIHNVSNQASINAMLPVSGAIILILLSIGLTLLGGLIPSRKAAKEDPVKALRTD